MDVDLRQQLPNTIAKKRSSLDSPDRNNPKKSKAEVFDRYMPKIRGNVQVSSNASNSRLFGDEDTDLRQLSVNTDRPSPPVRQRQSPISTGQLSPIHKDKAPITVDLESPEVTIIDDRPPTPPPPIISSNRDSPQRSESPRRNLDAIRAKLANATNRNKAKSCK